MVIEKRLPLLQVFLEFFRVWLHVDKPVSGDIFLERTHFYLANIQSYVRFVGWHKKRPLLNVWLKRMQKKVCCHFIWILIWILNLLAISPWVHFIIIVLQLLRSLLRSEVFFLNMEDGFFGCQVSKQLITSIHAFMHTISFLRDSMTILTICVLIHRFKLSHKKQLIFLSLETIALIG